MFDFLNRLFEWIFQFVPQFLIVGPNENGVRITCVPFIYKRSKTLGFGWYMYWPLFQEVYTLNIKSQILLVEVVVEDEGGEAVESTWAIQYWSRDVYKTMFEVEDHEERLAAHAVKVIGGRLKKGEEIDNTAISEIRSGVSGFGLWIQDVMPQHFVHAKAHKLFLENMTDKVGRIIGTVPV